jgi:hypothetical protein
MPDTGSWPSFLQLEIMLLQQVLLLERILEMLSLQLKNSG